MAGEVAAVLWIAQRKGQASGTKECVFVRAHLGTSLQRSAARALRESDETAPRRWEIHGDRAVMLSPAASERPRGVSFAALHGGRQNRNVRLLRLQAALCSGTKQRAQGTNAMSVSGYAVSNG